MRGTRPRLRPLEPPRSRLSHRQSQRNDQLESTDVRSRFPRFSPEARRANQPIVGLLDQIAERQNATPAQIALAWLLTQKPWIVPIPGTRKPERMEENLAAAGIDLTPEDLRELDLVTTSIRVHGARGTGSESYG